MSEVSTLSMNFNSTQVKMIRELLSSPLVTVPLRNASDAADLYKQFEIAAKHFELDKVAPPPTK